MNDAALLRQTLRRCTAILVATITITGVSLQEPAEAGLLLVIAVGAIAYLVNEFVVMSSSDDGSAANAENE